MWVRRETFDRKTRIVIEHHGTKRFVRVIDIETGEVLSQHWDEQRKAPSGRPPDSAKKPHFYRVYCTNWADLIDKKRLTFVEVGVLMSLLRFTDWESNFLVHPRTGKNLSASEIAGLLKTDRAGLMKHLEALHRKGLLAIVKCGGNGYANHYILNSHVVFKGSRMKDLNEHERFSKDCPYEPPLRVRYKEIVPQ